ncbi:hypothetical protein TNCV_557271 [Trichonephila clavipes]|uniref:Uncharacterized protein n=1 Tax=Trichonephila clavipes TaxID=2585209 RepID=A0A8X6RQL4_TRICX|nr:hypothetical protein TNCV_557271 [Trichonephila clavipes]
MVLSFGRVSPFGCGYASLMVMVMNLCPPCYELEPLKTSRVERADLRWIWRGVKIQSGVSLSHDHGSKLNAPSSITL